MTDVFTKEKRSDIMSRIRSKNTQPEILLFNTVKPLWHKGYRYFKHYNKLKGKPDLAFTKHKLAVFIDSEFWHGKNFQTWRDRLPEVYWQEKIKKNIDRDYATNHQLKKEGWQVIRIWSKDFIKDPSKYVKQIEKALYKRTVAGRSEQQF
ncbi:MAG: very short patch repair endonuclease [Thermodesulfobacteriota bacterium]